jgi:hypothetical protein
MQFEVVHVTHGCEKHYTAIYGHVGTTRKINSCEGHIECWSRGRRTAPEIRLASDKDEENGVCY